MKPLWRSSRGDFWVFIVCVVSVVTLGTQLGLLAGIAMSLFQLLGAYCAIRKDPAGEQAEAALKTPVGVTVVPCSKWLHFLNRYEVSRHVENALIHDPKARCVLDLRGIRYIDCSAMITVQVGTGASCQVGAVEELQSAWTEVLRAGGGKLRSHQIPTVWNGGGQDHRECRGTLGRGGEGP